MSLQDIITEKEIDVSTFSVEQQEEYIQELDLPLYSFHEAFYFVVITLITVGYGDINPTSPAGKILVITILVLTFIVIPQQSSELLRLMGLQSAFRRKIYKNEEDGNHIFVTGDITA